MTRTKWIRNGILIALTCGLFGAAHAQSSMLRAAPAIGGGVAAARATTALQANDAIWNYFTGLISQAVEKAMKMQVGGAATPIADDRIFDR